MIASSEVPDEWVKAVFTENWKQHTVFYNLQMARKVSNVGHEIHLSYLDNVVRFILADAYNKVEQFISMTYWTSDDVFQLIAERYGGRQNFQLPKHVSVR